MGALGAGPVLERLAEAWTEELAKFAADRLSPQLWLGAREERDVIAGRLEGALRVLGEVDHEGFWEDEE